MLNTGFIHIVKRDGRQEEFQPQKITQAICKAGKATGEFGEEMAKTFTLRVVNIVQQIYVQEIPTVEDIQDIVEDVLLSSVYRKTTKAYILYRQKHAEIREIASKFNTDLIDQYLKQNDWRVNENSNMAYSLQGLNHYISSEVSKLYWLNCIYPTTVKMAHQKWRYPCS
jgi:Oxygen-sensitive ribonucleoside-triphosphate reductase